MKKKKNMTSCDWWNIKWNTKYGTNDLYSLNPHYTAVDLAMVSYFIYTMQQFSWKLELLDN